MANAIRYLRTALSNADEFMDLQDDLTLAWARVNQVGVVRTFIDRGCSGNPFDLPAFRSMKQAMKMHHQEIDFLLVYALDRIGRNPSDLLPFLKTIQYDYRIQLISVNELYADLKDVPPFRY